MPKFDIFPRIFYNDLISVKKGLNHNYETMCWGSRLEAPHAEGPLSAIALAELHWHQRDTSRRPPRCC
jgi:hypothetical protein